jgi:hypothetical protein
VLLTLLQHDDRLEGDAADRAIGCDETDRAIGRDRALETTPRPLRGSTVTRERARSRARAARPTAPRRDGSARRRRARQRGS